MQDDYRRSRYVGSFFRFRCRVSTRPRRFSSVPALWHPATCRFESSSFLSQAFEDRHFTWREISFETLNEVRRIWIGASRLEDSIRQWTGYFSFRGRSFQRVRVLAVEHELTSLVMHRRPRGYDARVSLPCQFSDFELGIQRVPRMHFPESAPRFR
jgi:hypothetical protein